jgi:uncharacterized membrane protein YczE
LKKRILVYVAGMMIYGFAVCLMAKADIGISPITSIAFALYHIFPDLSLGITQLIMNGLFVLAQAVLLGRQFEKIQYLQFAASILFSFFIDLTMPLVEMIASFHDGFMFRIVLFAISMLTMAIGLTIILITGLIMLPGDGIAKTIAKKLNWNFGKAKVIFDSSCVASTCIISLLVLHEIVGIQIGTVIAALCLGRIVRLFSSILKARKIHTDLSPDQQVHDGARVSVSKGNQ